LAAVRIGALEAFLVLASPAWDAHRLLELLRLHLTLKDEAVARGVSSFGPVYLCPGVLRLAVPVPPLVDESLSSLINDRRHFPLSPPHLAEEDLDDAPCLSPGVLEQHRC
jgi:hypothetical protein